MRKQQESTAYALQKWSQTSRPWVLEVSLPGVTVEVTCNRQSTRLGAGTENSLRWHRHGDISFHSSELSPCRQHNTMMPLEAVSVNLVLGPQARHLRNGRGTWLKTAAARALVLAATRAALEHCRRTQRLAHHFVSGLRAKLAMLLGAGQRRTQYHETWSTQPACLQMERAEYSNSFKGSCIHTGASEGAGMEITTNLPLNARCW